MIERKKAFITGIAGQDGSYLAELLLDKKYDVVGLTKEGAILSNIDKIRHSIKLYEGNLCDFSLLKNIIRFEKPDEIYNLASQSSAANSFLNPKETFEVNTLVVVKLLGLIKNYLPEAKLFQASSSEIYGKTNTIIQNELTRKAPGNPYAVSKIAADEMIRIFREKYNIYACSGILYNHESPRRKMEFITRKLAYSAACIKNGIDNSYQIAFDGKSVVRGGKVHVGNLDSQRDWGYSPDYVKAMWMMLQKDRPKDYILATGITHTVKDLCREVFACIEQDWEKFVVVDPFFVRPNENGILKGDTTSIKKDLGWQSKTDFRKMIRILVDAELDKYKNR